MPELYRNTPVCEDPQHIDQTHEQRILAQIPDEDAAVDIADLFSQLGDSTRVRLLSMLAMEPMCVCEMADILRMSQPAVSHHLRMLRQSGVVRFKKDGKRAFYSLSESKSGRMARQMLSVIHNDGEEQ